MYVGKKLIWCIEKANDTQNYKHEICSRRKSITENQGTFLVFARSNLTTKLSKSHFKYIEKFF